jgi:hypothetical protein
MNQSFLISRLNMEIYSFTLHLLLRRYSEIRREIMQAESKVERHTYSNITDTLVVLFILFLLVIIYTEPYYLALAFKPTPPTEQTPPETTTAPPQTTTTTAYTAQLSGNNEVPPTDSSATAYAYLETAGNELKYSIGETGIADPTATHLHSGTNGENGDIVADLPSSYKNWNITHKFSDGSITNSDLIGPLKGKTLEDLMAAMDKGEIYINIHSILHPEGEIRGQIALASQ